MKINTIFIQTTDDSKDKTAIFIKLLFNGFSTISKIVCIKQVLSYVDSSLPISKVH